MAGRKKSDVGKEESKADKSVRLAQQRVGMALKYLNLVGNLAGTGYEFTQAQKDKMVSTLEDATARVKDRFGGKSQSATGFQL